jgi:hypothetical protein
MSDWRDDLPPIPADRIRSNAIREGTRRREQRQRRQRTILLGAMGAAAVAVIVVSGVLTRPADDDDGTAATATTAAAGAETTAAAGPETTAAAGPETTEAAGPETTAAAGPETTEAAEATTADTVAVDYTTIGGPTAALPVNPQIEVVPAAIWEQRSSGPACGPTTLEVVIPQSLGLAGPVARWQTADLTGEVAMIIEGEVAHATIGPFAPESLDIGARHELLVLVVGTDQSGGEQVVRAPTVVLTDCS